MDSEQKVKAADSKAFAWCGDGRWIIYSGKNVWEPLSFIWSSESAAWYSAAGHESVVSFWNAEGLKLECPVCHSPMDIFCYHCMGDEQTGRREGGWRERAAHAGAVSLPRARRRLLPSGAGVWRVCTAVSGGSEDSMSTNELANWMLLGQMAAIVVFVIGCGLVWLINRLKRRFRAWTQSRR